MNELISVKVSKKYQIAVPSKARERLNIQQGDRLLVDVQDGMLILIPQPKNYAADMTGLHQDVWRGIDSSDYLREERTLWGDSAKS